MVSNLYIKYRLLLKFMLDNTILGIQYCKSERLGRIMKFYYRPQKSHRFRKESQEIRKYLLRQDVYPRKCSANKHVIAFEVFVPTVSYFNLALELAWGNLKSTRKIDFFSEKCFAFSEKTGAIMEVGPDKVNNL